MFFPQTPGGELARRWREVDDRGARSRGWRFRVVELGGRKVSSILFGDPWRGPCRKPDCLVCSSGGRGACGRPGCTYDIVCRTCQETDLSTVPDQEYDKVGQNAIPTIPTIPTVPTIPNIPTTWGCSKLKPETWLGKKQ